MSVQSPADWLRSPKNSSRNSEDRKLTSSWVKPPQDRSYSTTASSTNRGTLDGKEAELDPCSRSLKVKACSWQWSLSCGRRVEPLALLDRRLFHSTAKQFRTRTWKSFVCWEKNKQKYEAHRKHLDIWIHFITFKRNQTVSKVPTIFDQG